MFALYTNTVSAHQLPLARELADALGAENFRYVYVSEPEGSNQETREREPWMVRADAPGAAEMLESCDTLLAGGMRPVDIFERRVACGRLTFYQTERWFKPIRIFGRLLVPGIIRLLHPGYRRMARRFARLMENDSFRVLPIGPWAAHDMEEVFRRFHPGVAFAHKFLPWGYFVAPGAGTARRIPAGGELKVLWVGRLIGLKRVDTIVDAVAKLRSSGDKKIVLTIVGDGPEKRKLERRAARRCGTAVRFSHSVAIGEVRKLMQYHDVLVFSSNALDGWGAVVSEALEEGMSVFGTVETGASATLLPRSRQFHCGDTAALAQLLADAREMDPSPMPEGFTAKGAARRLLAEALPMEEGAANDRD